MKNNGFEYKTECFYEYLKHAEKTAGKIHLKYSYEGVIPPLLHRNKSV